MRNPTFAQNGVIVATNGVDSMAPTAVGEKLPTMLSSTLQMAVETRNLHFRYDYNLFDLSTIITDPLGKLNGLMKESKPVLQNVSISVPKGKIYALLGPSGCGKLMDNSKD